MPRPSPAPNLSTMVLNPDLYATAPVRADRDTFLATLPGGIEVTFTRRSSGWDMTLDVDVRLPSGVRVGVIRGRTPTEDVRVLWGHLAERAFATQEEIETTALADIVDELKALTAKLAPGDPTT